VSPDDRAALRAQLRRHEGTGPMRQGRFLPYRDTVGKLTIGYGRNLEDVGISQAEADFQLENDLDDRARMLASLLPWFSALDAVRQRALVDMAFMGTAKLLTFRKMLAALGQGDYATAAAEARDSLWATQGGARAVTVARMLETGEA